MPTEFPGNEIPVSHSGDLRLPSWGPYTKEYAGISHIPEIERGIRFDLAVFPGLYRRRQSLPSVTYESGYYAWSADPKLKQFTYRHVLTDLDSCYADITYTEEPDGRLIRTRFVNRTSLPQQASLHYLGSVHFPEIGPYHLPALRPAVVDLPEGAVWIEGTQYAELRFDEDSPRRHLPDNAEIWGAVRKDELVRGVGLGSGFGKRAGDRVAYAAPPAFAIAGTIALIRYRLAQGARLALRCAGAYGGRLLLIGNGEFQLAQLSPDDPTLCSFKLESEGGSEIEINGCVLVQQGLSDKVGFHTPALEYRPQISHKAGDTKLVLKYPAIGGYYGVAWEAEASEVREWLSDDLDRDFPFFTHEHVKRVFDQGGEHHYAEAFVRPVFLQPGETRDLHAYVTFDESRERVAARLEQFQTQGRSSQPPATPESAALFESTEAGRPFAFGAERLAAVITTNIVYPVRRRGKFIRHYTPGRWWDSLYTWDSGFIGLGLLELDPERSVDNLAAYLTDSADDCAFVHHGSPLPVQIYQLQALWNCTQDMALLARFFPGALRMHRFLMGRSEGSRTSTLRSGLLRTWDYFYNSGGWDDYPPQQHMRGTTLAQTIAPVINSAHAIRSARLLRAMALILNEPTEEFDKDCAVLTAALQTHSWNSASGWFSYVRHDAEGNASGPLLHESGADFNRGMDGISPLVAGICTEDQEALFLRRLQDDKVFWTVCGLSTVDQSAPYYRTDGYWNGAVWMPHQWFFWKSLLDLGQAALAWRIAHTALETWDKEVRATGCCFEHFIVSTGRGAGWHQFGGLSSPVLLWFAAYFRPGNLTGGFDCWVMNKAYDGHTLRSRLRFTGSDRHAPTVVAVVPSASTATVRWNGESIPFIARQPGTLEIQLPRGAGDGELVVS